MSAYEARFAVGDPQDKAPATGSLEELWWVPPSVHHPNQYLPVRALSSARFRCPRCEVRWIAEEPCWVCGNTRVRVLSDGTASMREDAGYYTIKTESDELMADCE